MHAIQNKKKASLFQTTRQKSAHGMLQCTFCFYWFSNYIHRWHILPSVWPQNGINEHTVQYSPKTGESSPTNVKESPAISRKQKHAKSETIPGNLSLFHIRQTDNNNHR
jgi:hypothetical protein